MSSLEYHRSVFLAVVGTAAAWSAQDWSHILSIVLSVITAGFVFTKWIFLILDRKAKRDKKE